MKKGKGTSTTKRKNRRVLDRLNDMKSIRKKGRTIIEGWDWVFKTETGKKHGLQEEKIEGSRISEHHFSESKRGN
jgi:hypothetical protein